MLVEHFEKLQQITFIGTYSIVHLEMLSKRYQARKNHLSSNRKIEHPIICSCKNVTQQNNWNFESGLKAVYIFQYKPHQDFNEDTD